MSAALFRRPWFHAILITAAAFAAIVIAGSEDRAQPPDWNETYGKLPMSFEANQGQTADPVKYISRGSGYNLFLTPTEAVVTLTSRSENPKAASVRMKLSGANPDPEISGLDEQPGKVNYFIGADPAQWRTNVATYSKVKYEEVYPGIDLVYYGNQRQLEYDFVVGPHANPDAIRLGFEGGRGLSIDAREDLVIETGGEEIRMTKPRVYQDDGDSKHEIAARYVLLESGQVGFEIGSYDREKALIIDPVLNYSTFLGGSGSDLGHGIAVDSAGYAYITGYTGSIDFPAADPLQATHSGGSFDVFVSKLSADGSFLVYSTYAGGNNLDFGNGIAVDLSGNAYVTGFTASTNFPVANALQATIGGGEDAVVFKLNANGSVLVYSTYVGGTAGDYGNGITVDSFGSAYIAGHTGSLTFPIANARQPLFGGGFYDAFISKINAAGSALVYSTYLGGSGLDIAFGIALDGGRNAYVTGQTDSPNFPTMNAYQPFYAGGGLDAVVSVLTTTGASFLFSTYLGGTSVEAGYGIAVDSAGSAYITGETTSTNFPRANPIQLFYGGGSSDAIVSKFSVGGFGLQYSTYLGGTGLDRGTGITVDGLGSAFVVGQTESANFPVRANPIQPSIGGGFDVFVSRLNGAGSDLAYSTFIGGSSSDNAKAIALDGSGNAYIAGFTESLNFPISTLLQPTIGGGLDAFVSKISPLPGCGVSLPLTVNGRPGIVDLSFGIGTPQPVTGTWVVGFLIFDGNSLTFSGFPVFTGTLPSQQTSQNEFNAVSAAECQSVDIRTANADHGCSEGECLHDVDAGADSRVE